jgi:hypothetical protein
MRAILVSILVTACACACGSSAKGTGTGTGTGPSTAAWPPDPPPPGTSRALAKVAWLVGSWRTANGFSEQHWVAAGGTIYGAHFENGSWSVDIIDDSDDKSETADGVLRFIAHGDGHAVKEYRVEGEPEANHVVFANPEYGGSKLDFKLAGDVLTATLFEGDTAVEATYQRVTATPATQLEKNDLAFAVDAKARGAEGWASWFAETGVQWSSERLEGRAAIAAHMEKTLTAGELAWTPIASGLSEDLGFTVGTAAFTPNGATAAVWRGSYVTIWAPQPDGVWRVVFDTGRGEQAEPSAAAAAAAAATTPTTPTPPTTSN